MTAAVSRADTAAVLAAAGLTTIWTPADTAQLRADLPRVAGAGSVARADRILDSWHLTEADDRTIGRGLHPGNGNGARVDALALLARIRDDLPADRRQDPDADAIHVAAAICRRASCELRDDDGYGPGTAWDDICEAADELADLAGADDEWTARAALDSWREPYGTDPVGAAGVRVDDLRAQLAGHLEEQR